MSLRELLNSNRHQQHHPVQHIEPTVQQASGAQLKKTPFDREFVSLKEELHQELLKQFDLGSVDNVSEPQLKEQLAAFVIEALKTRNAPITEAIRKNLIAAIQSEVIGYGPLDTILADSSVTDVLVNGPYSVFVERKGKLEKTDVSFADDDHLMRIVEKIVSRVGRRVDESSPMADARLPDGSRVNVIIPPLALDGPTMSIRKFPGKPLNADQLIRNGSATGEMIELLSAMVRSGLNIIVSGGTGSGKTTMLNLLSGFIPEDERVVTIEDVAELRLQQPHVVRLETRPANTEGRGAVELRALVKNALRMRPDRIVVGEVRGIEVLDMLQAMNTGHEGSMSTIHANSAIDALTRIENMIGMSGMTLPTKPMRQNIVSALDVIVQVSRLTDGKRKIVSILEIVGMEGDLIATQEIFRFRQTGVSQDGTVLGRFCATGIRPRFAERLFSLGHILPERIFDVT